jgi:hypothetical protein
VIGRLTRGYEIVVATTPSKRAIVRALLDRHGRTYAEELGIRLLRPSPSALFQLMCASILFSARIGSNIAAEASRNLARRGWRTPQAMAESSWDERVAALNDAGYTRYQERTATMLGDTVQLVLDRWDGDLRKLRDEAGREPRRERTLLKQAKGLGDVGVDIFFREVQVGWNELIPFADKRALAAARRIELGADARELRRLARDDREFARIVAALVRVGLDNDFEAVLAAAR